MIPKEYWSIPKHIDVERHNKSIEYMNTQGVMAGDILSYHHMCRFYSGFFYQHELLKSYDYYWRVEPGVDFFCDIDFDPFIYMKKTISRLTLVPYENLNTIPTLWNTTKEFIRTYPHLITNDSIFDFITDDQGETYNLCQFWSKFEIGDFSLWRSEAYTKFFDFLDKKGGFYYERWGDAPVHTIAAALFLKKHQVRYFEEIGYSHSGLVNCPRGREFRYKRLCFP
ncbi:2886_t:CDS:2, partial [Racocetra persica]